MYFDSLIKKSTNKAKMTWNIVKLLLNNDTNNNKDTVHDNTNSQNIANALNSYFTSVADNIIHNSLKTV